MLEFKGMALGGCFLLTTALAVGAASPAAAASDSPPVMKLKGSKTALTTSKASVKPGVVQFNVAKTQPDDPQAGPDAIIVIKTKNIDKWLDHIRVVFSDASESQVASAMTWLNAHTEAYGGGREGTVWQVSLPKGTYYALSNNSVPMQDPLMSTFKVKGKPGSTTLHKTNATVTAAKPNVWKTKGLGKLGKGWLTFRNTSKELHFMALDGVKPDTTNKMVKDALASPDEPTFFNKQGFFFDVISPGIEVSVKAPIKKGKYLLTCFVPSEVDGMPHALMGMWKLVDIA